MALTVPQIQNLKNAFLLAELRKAAVKEFSTENFDFIFDKSNNQTLYTKWISPTSKTQVNLPGAIQKALDEQAKAKKWGDMSANISKAKDNIAKLFNSDTIARFSGTPDGRLSVAVAQMGVDNAGKAAQIKALLPVYLKPRSPSDQYQAYLALQKLVSKSKLDPVLKAMDVPPPTGPVDDKATVAQNMKVDAIAKKMKVDIAASLKYFESAMKFFKAKGVPSDKDEIDTMFASGRMRHERVHLPYNDAIQLDKAFTAKYKDVVAQKKELDKAWAEFRTKLNKK